MPFLMDQPFLQVKVHCLSVSFPIGLDLGLPAPLSPTALSTFPTWAPVDRILYHLS